MAVSQVVVCDCCETQINSSSVLDAVIVTYLKESGEVAQAHFGLACGCGGGVVAGALEGDHGTHVPPPAPVAPTADQQAPPGPGAPADDTPPPTPNDAPEQTPTP